jgi:hypothetical protein
MGDAARIESMLVLSIAGDWGFARVFFLVIFWGACGCTGFEFGMRRRGCFIGF